MQISSIIIGLSLAASLIGTAIVRSNAAKLGLIDYPNNRSSHEQPTPSGGGLAFVTSFLLGLFLLTNTHYIDDNLLYPMALALSCVVIAGIVDDILGLSALSRLFLQSLGLFSVMLLWGGIAKIDLGYMIVNGSSLLQIIIFIGLLWLINLYNFMDGIDGLATVQAITTIGAIFVQIYFFSPNNQVLIVLGLLLACLLGFLPWNWPNARIFMGDTGSYFLGMFFALLILITIQEDSISVWSWCILLAFFWVDATFTLIRRILRGKRWYLPHCCHAHQRLASRWQSHRLVTGMVFVLNTIWLFPMSCLTIRYPDYAMLWTVFALLPVLAICIWTKAGKD